MPQLHLYVPDEVAEKLKLKAEKAGLSMSRYLAELAVREVEHGDWPEGYFEAVFQRQPEPLVRPPQDEWRERTELI